MANINPELTNSKGARFGFSLDYDYSTIDGPNIEYAWPNGKTMDVPRGIPPKFLNYDLGESVDPLIRMVFNLPEVIDEPNCLLVYVNGIYQDPVNYVLEDGNTKIRFTDPIPEGWLVEITYTT